MLFTPLARSEEPARADSKTQPGQVAAPAGSDSVQDPLLRVLVSKGILTSEEASAVTAAPPSEQRDQLAALLHSKGIISDAEYQTIHPVMVASTSPTPLPASASASTRPLNFPVANSPSAASAVAVAAPPAPSVIPAVNPMQLLPVTVPKREGIIPDIKLGGSGAFMQPYGFLKASLMNDTSDPGGDDFPLPGFIGDTGPNGASEVHVKARSSRIGLNFGWLDPSTKWVITGKLEGDFEGNFSRADNRNLSSVRSNMFSIRLAYGRIDRVFTDKTSMHMLFGQDWTPFTSSTLPLLLETTGLGLDFGDTYERLPQARFGITHQVAPSVSITPEIALVMPAFGNVPANVAQQLGYAERQGADSDRPEIQGRLVTQFQLDHAPGVAPAQFILSFTQGKRTAIVTAAGVPTAYHEFFPYGATVSSERYGYTGELQLPTRWATLIGKYYSGSDLRFYFGGQLYSNFNDTSGLTNTASASNIDASSTVLFGMRNGVPVVAPQRSVRSEGGFVDLGLPLSRWFNANPAGRNAGWQINLISGVDYAFARDVRQLDGTRGRSDMAVGNITYKLNKMVTFEFEESYYRTKAPNETGLGAGNNFRGIPSVFWHDVRSEFGTIFAF
jgi:hypothetical protein